MPLQTIGKYSPVIEFHVIEVSKLKIFHNICSLNAEKKKINSQILIDVKCIFLACEDYLIYTGRNWMDGWMFYYDH